MWSFIHVVELDLKLKNHKYQLKKNEKIENHVLNFTLRGQRVKYTTQRLSILFICDF